MHLCKKRNRTVSIRTSTFKKVTFVSPPCPEVDKSIDVLGGDAVPATEDLERVPIARPVVPIFVEPVPAVAEEVSAESPRHGSMLVSLFANPVKCSIKGSFTGT